MKALVYAGGTKKAFEEHANPEIQSPTDAIVGPGVAAFKPGDRADKTKALKVLVEA